MADCDRMEQGLRYPDEFADRLELIWGAGFLSPGGADEVREILRGTDLSSKTVLEIGCGIGGPAIVMAGELSAAKVVGIDIEPQLIERAQRNANAAGVIASTEFKLVDPGPLPFEPASFDVVFSKDAIVHIEDKQALYGEILRVLAPGGQFIAGDWFASADADDLPEFRRYRELSHLDFAMQTGSQAEAALVGAGFADVELDDRNAWYVEFASTQIVRIEGELRNKLIEVCGTEQYESILRVSYANAAAAACGGLRPTHVRAVKPAAS